MSSGYLPWLVPAPESGTRHDARVRLGVSNECGTLLPMWRDGVRSLSVDAAAYEPVLGALSIHTTACEYAYGASCCFRLHPAAKFWR